MSERAELELAAGTLEPGESVRMVCPFCGGGHGGERSLSLTHREDGTLLYHCYRAKCGAAGALGAGARRLLSRTPQVPKASRVKPSVEDRLRELRGSGTVWGLHAYDWTSVGAKWDDETQRMALPVYDPSYVLRGRVLRTMPGDTRQPKTLMLMYVDEPSLCWNRRDGDTTVVVEDIPSALKLSLCGYRAVALNGTHMTDSAVEELDRHSTNVIWALDRDAFAKACAYASRYRIYFKESVALLLERDFKDLDWQEVDACLSEIYWDLSSGVERLGSESET